MSARRTGGGLSLSRLRLIAVAGLVVTVAIAVWLLPRMPIVAALLLVPVAGFAVFQIVALRAREKIVDAALRCDVAALELLAQKGSLLGRVQATFALFHHGSFHLPTPTACVCGECDKDLFEKELDITRRVARLAWEGRGAEAMTLAAADPVIASGVLGEVVTHMRLVNRFVAFKLDPDAATKLSLPSAWTDRMLRAAEEGVPWVLWPMRLATAVEATRRGDEAAARKHVAGMPSWPEGTPLERARRELMADLGEREGTSSQRRGPRSTRSV